MKASISWFSTAALSLTLAACGSDPETPPSGDSDAGTGGTGGVTQMDSGGVGMDAAPTGPTFSRIYDEIIVRRCSGMFCHDTIAGGNLIMTASRNAEAARGELVDEPATGGECGESGLTRVVPGQPEQSLFYLKLIEPAPCGEVMPPEGAPLLSAEELELVRAWIAEGAQAN